MTKYILVALMVVLLIALVGCVNTTEVIGEMKTYEIASDINSLDIKINAADVVIEHSDKFSVESNLINLEVNEKDGVLQIVEKTKNAKSYNDAMLKLYIPDDVVFKAVNVGTGAGRLTAASLSADTMNLKSGAGKVQIEKLVVNSNVGIKGGAGEINIQDGKLNNLSLDLGVGELDMTAQLLGESNLKFGVGESNLTLIGSKNDYSFDIKQSIGEITVDNNDASTFAGNTNGQNLVKIKGGVGVTNISFQ